MLPKSPTGKSLPAAALAHLEFTFVIDPRGRITTFAASVALQRLGWGDDLVGRNCQVALACRDLQGRSLCEICLGLRARRPRTERTRPPGVIGAPAAGADVLVPTSTAQRLARRLVRVSGRV